MQWLRGNWEGGGREDGHRGQRREKRDVCGCAGRGGGGEHGSLEGGGEDEERGEGQGNAEPGELFLDACSSWVAGGGRRKDGPVSHSASHPTALQKAASHRFFVDPTSVRRLLTADLTMGTESAAHT